MNEIIRNAQSAVANTSLDPQDWSEFRTLAHRMLDETIDGIANVRARPVWRPIPDDVRAAFRADVPREASDLAEVYREFSEHVAPYATGNVHPGFMGWVHGGGTAVGMLAEMLAAGLNANLGGRDHMPIEVERQIIEWMRCLFLFPESASGIFVTGTSMANLMAVLVARTAALGTLARQHGIGNDGALLTAYTSQAAHGCIARATDIAGLGTDALRKIAVDADHRIDVAALRAQIAVDREVGFKPFLVVASAGTVDIGAIDDLRAIAELCREEAIWFHVDGAFGALAILAPELAPLLGGIELADSIALDFHKWGQVPYDAGFLLVRDGEQHRQAFAQPAAYLSREARGLAAGAVWPCDLGPDLSRGFRALKTWFTLKTFGTDRLGAAVARSCALAKYLETRVLAEPRLELLAPVNLNIVCFRYRSGDAVNREIVADIQESGIAAPSSTTLDGKLAIRAAIVNHRTEEADIDALVAAVLQFGGQRSGGVIEVDAPPLAAQ
ncbi:MULTISPECIES: pyridoxal phosphate-dependent decarboxylase family protein [Bradyrhizobium]|uniref:pyridoxal phosphate-dependent decarboxylase family protein n=1 Tax=Bradyrhizobium TaxID=374 RepID=UPI00155EB2AD|nr:MULTISPECIES: aspartate aminotransferase family protein [Bradyrhizobium]MDD1518284.1 cytochrome D ubiquinol oxidase subunit I [Bradyrhizobium sp. WBAH30]MDD1542081.1 cytochrome D ubiquinol oxidase subunit I [Bradyrhizobium sp. WBAH41]MDD1556233.1 cytochrome D ubiquinol oxidase subunit I [Bradyrhizobium sp. WBAH23]MDD1561926.1 cytochrome D ubiquinol oxidase subunit I [Bradyrhizobium sp. WBAH33]MDD1589053.1 cytochrome D ubiquinol oxidase subunit I [Bradyrhizobium sp. WBAH42]